jgi:hypothetical protein
MLTIFLFVQTLDQDKIISTDIRDLIDWVVIAVLGLDVLGRLVFKGSRFFRSVINVFELALVPLAIVELLLLRNLNLPI